MKIHLVICFLAAFLLTTPPSFAGITFGVKAGASFNSVHFTDADNTPHQIATYFNESVRSRAGFVGGVFSNAPLGKRFSFQAELLYVSKFWKSTFDNQNGLPPIDIYYSVGYLELPVLIQVTPFSLPTLKPSLYFGPSAAIKIRDIAYIKDGSNSFKTDSDYNNLDYGVIGGVNLCWRKLSLDLRYNFGRADITKGNLVKTTNRTFYIMTGYGF